MATPQDLKSLQAELDRCVKCGMCLAECPTYRLEADENESPRGRLALIEGLIAGRLQADGPLTAHLDHCLGCRRCERVCPSQVRYGYLLDRTRALLPDRHVPRWHGLVQKPSLMRLGTGLARALPTMLSVGLGTVHRLHELAVALGNPAAAPAPGTYPAGSDNPRGQVGLFGGCAVPVQQGGALHAALRLLQYARFGVRIPRQDLCCGALSQHAGSPGKASVQAEQVRHAFDADIDAIVSLASGCGIHIDSYQPALRAGHQDICRFLLEHGRLTRDDFLPLHTRAYLHTPCSVENVYRGGDWAHRLLALIPGLEVVSVGEAGQCCGAAGDYMLRYPASADRLRRPLLNGLPDQAGVMLLTSNVGCAMHLAAGLRGRDGDIEVLHPVELLARQLRE
jgi:glycolate oxidase iron-sulfur subunit